MLGIQIVQQKINLKNKPTRLIHCQHTSDYDDYVPALKKLQTF